MKENKMKLRLISRREVWVPTKLGALALITLLALPVVWWLYEGESFLSENRRLPAAKILVVEGWIGPEGVRAAKLAPTAR